MIFGKLEYHFIWMGLGLPTRLTHVKVHEQPVHDYGRKALKDLKGSTLPRGKKKSVVVTKLGFKIKFNNKILNSIYLKSKYCNKTMT